MNDDIFEKNPKELSSKENRWRNINKDFERAKFPKNLNLTS